ncbi:MAG: hypothetical protein K0R10_1836 [Alphaproteobacteria bacterium]|nr:hypothetical protein [Alphaproteobacteria bacterium]
MLDAEQGRFLMSREYAMSRVKDALEKSNGNHLKAQRLLLQWMEKDQSLLFGLVTPHMQSIRRIRRCDAGRIEGRRG